MNIIRRHLPLEASRPVWKTCFVQHRRATADWPCAMPRPRNLYPDTTLFITCQCVHHSYRLVLTERVNRVVKYAFAVVSSRYRNHVVLYDRHGKASDFVRDLNAVIGRALNSAR